MLRLFDNNKDDIWIIIHRRNWLTNDQSKLSSEDDIGNENLHRQILSLITAKKNTFHIKIYMPQGIIDRPTENNYMHCLCSVVMSKVFVLKIFSWSKLFIGSWM